MEELHKIKQKKEKCGKLDRFGENLYNCELKNFRVIHISYTCKPNKKSQ